MRMSLSEMDDHFTFGDRRMGKKSTCTYTYTRPHASSSPEPVSSCRLPPFLLELPSLYAILSILSIDKIENIAKKRLVAAPTSEQLHKMKPIADRYTIFRVIFYYIKEKTARNRRFCMQKGQICSA